MWLQSEVSNQGHAIWIGPASGGRRDGACVAIPHESEKKYLVDNQAVGVRHERERHDQGVARDICGTEARRAREIIHRRPLRREAFRHPSYGSTYQNSDAERHRFEGQDPTDLSIHSSIRPVLFRSNTQHHRTTSLAQTAPPIPSDVQMMFGDWQWRSRL